jgi:hypothetical protein
MADNMDEEHLDSSTNTQSDNPSDEIIPTEDTENINLNQETKNMEVYHHPDLHHKLKKWKDYFLEFLMIFLAVFLGFIAENIRESSVERKKEKEYIHSMINDLKTDTSKLNVVTANYQQFILKQDTLLMTFSSLNIGFNCKFFRNLGGIGGYPDFIYTDATIQQLKNSGGFGILRNRKDIDSIMVYDEIVKKALINEAILGKSFVMQVDLTNETFNFQNLSEQRQQGKSLEKLETEKFDWLLTHDKNTLSKYYNHLRFYSNLCKGSLNDMKGVKIEATRLINYLEREYDKQ